MPLFSVIYQGKSKEINLDNGEFTVGRGKDCSISLPDGTLSRKHIQILIDDSGTFVEDKGSRNGTLVNRVKISGRVRLRDGDEIKIGETKIFVGKPPSSSITSSTEKPITRKGKAYSVLPDVYFAAQTTKEKIISIVTTVFLFILSAALLAAVAMIVVKANSEVSQETAGILADPSFEKDISEWKSINQRAVPFQGEVSRTGSKSLRIQAFGGEESGTCLANSIPIRGQGVEFSGYMKSEGYSGTAIPFFTYSSKKLGRWLTIFGSPVKPSSNWDAFKFQSSPPAGADSVVPGIKLLGSSDGSVFIDDVEITKKQVSYTQDISAFSAAGTEFGRMLLKFRGKPVILELESSVTIKGKKYETAAAVAPAGTGEPLPVSLYSIAADSIQGKITAHVEKQACIYAVQLDAKGVDSAEITFNVPTDGLDETKNMVSLMDYTVIFDFLDGVKSSWKKGAGISTCTLSFARELVEDKDMGAAFGFSIRASEENPEKILQIMKDAATRYFEQGNYVEATKAYKEILVRKKGVDDEARTRMETIERKREEELSRMSFDSFRAKILMDKKLAEDILNSIAGFTQRFGKDILVESIRSDAILILKVDQRRENISKLLRKRAHDYAGSGKTTIAGIIMESLLHKYREFCTPDDYDFSKEVSPE